MCDAFARHSKRDSRMKLSNATIDVLLQGKQLQELQVSTATDGKSLECFLEPFCGDCIDIKAVFSSFNHLSFS